MITTTHVILNTTILGSQKHPELNWPIVLGSIFPDITSFLVIFSPLYYVLGAGNLLNYVFFQNYTDWFHSIPLALTGLLLCVPFQFKRGIYFFMSMTLHDLEDLPVQTQIAHKHFYLLANMFFTVPFLIGNLNTMLLW
jgi:hypothetical protein